MAKPTIEAITAETLPEFAAFLAANMSVPRSASEWTAGLSTHWRGERPNHGFLMRDGGQVVGGIGAFYAERPIRGQIERFCNITSWCVLDTYRKFSMQLAMAVVAQKGYHFTDFSPTKVVSSTLQFLKFKPLDEAVLVVANVPGVPGRGRAISSPMQIERALVGEDAARWDDHRLFPWLRHVLIGTPGRWCHVIYKRMRFKGLPCARVLYVGDALVLEQHFGVLRTHLLARGMLVTRIERRLLSHVPKFSHIQTGYNAKVYLSEFLGPKDVDYLYSETMALDL